MPQRISNLDVKFISLVKSGSNRKRIIWKSGDAFPRVTNIPIRKTDDEQRIVYGIVYSPDEEDTHGHFATAQDIQKASQQFMKSLNLHNIDRQHDLNPIDAYVAENWITKAGDPVFPDDPEGSWAIGIKVNSDKEWEDVKSGTLAALSMWGTADVHVSKALDFDNARAIDDMWKYFNALERAINSIMGDDAIEDKPAAIRESIDQFKSEITGKLGASAEIKKDGIFERIIKKFKGDNDMNKQEVEAIVKEAIGKAEKPLTAEQITEIVKKETGGLADIVAKAVADGIAPLNTRLETIEKSSPGSNQDGRSGGGDFTNDELDAIGKQIAARFQ